MAFQGALKVKQELLWSKETKEQKETMDRDGDEGVSQMAPGNRSTLSAENTLVRGDLPHGPAGEDTVLHCRGRRFDPWSGN